MWLELCIAPLAEREPIVLVWDNCGSHKTDGVKKFAASLAGGNINIVNLLENTTDLLQVMDLVVNAPVKSDIRHYRISQAAAAFNIFQDELMRRKEALGDKFTLNDVGMFIPPKIPLCSGIDCVLATLGSGHLAPAVQKAFITTGLCKDPATGAYYKLKLKDLRADMGKLELPSGIEDRWTGADFLLGIPPEVRPVAVPDDVDNADDAADDNGPGDSGDDDE